MPMIIAGVRRETIGLAVLRSSLYRRRFQTGPPGRKACRGDPECHRLRALTGSKMPKLKTKSGAKKRFKMTASGKLKAGVAGKRHRLISHNGKYIRQQRGTKGRAALVTKIVMAYLPYGR